jgi:hypothetical protein
LLFAVFPGLSAFPQSGMAPWAAKATELQATAQFDIVWIRANYNCCTVLGSFSESGLERQERLARAFVCNLPERIFGYT